MDPTTNANRNMFQPGETVQIEYDGGWIGAEGLEVGLYRQVPAGSFNAWSNTILIDSWSVEIASEEDLFGQSYESIVIPESSPVGDYFLVVTQMEVPAFEFVSATNLVDSYQERFYQYQLLTLSTHVLAFVAGPAQQRDIYTINFDGSNRRALTGPNTFDNAEPAWSPDGRYIAYQSNATGNYDIWIMDADGRNPRPLTTSSVDEREPGWSSDGQYIVYRRGGEGNGNGELWIMDVNGSNQQPLGVESILGRSPVWSPHDDEIAFMSLQNGSWQIYTYHLDSGTIRQITDCTTHCRFPRWNAKWESIYYSETRSLADYTPIAIFDAGSFEIGQIAATGTPGRPSHSSNGWLVFNSENGLEAMDPYNPHTRYVIPNTEDGFAPVWSE